ncbi:hypothetical protein LWE61_11250 [Sphingobium sufflavum]|uniref:hypothetical protein n=1 Tax=Sphingobium sufflavum TaxID=1129547 RepID=UPI001F401C4A|nr:hypothetical protein [Sphingobium sufflavum]MCE7797134.1 hypothetical protein [Sphingobium sufflavum]
MYNQASQNLEQARAMRAAGRSYREIARQLDLTTSQIGLIRRTLKREKAARTRMRGRDPGATDRDIPVRQSGLPSGLRLSLSTLGFRTIGDLADRLADPLFPGLTTLAGIGPHRARLVEGLLDHYGLLPGPDDLRSAVEDIFPELRHGPTPD